MSEFPSTAKVVVIGAGIVGNSLVGHLAELGWRDIVQIDKGPLPNPGGSTGHASNFIFPVDHNREMAALNLDSQRQYEAMGVNVFSGGIEIARTDERMEELRRRMTSAKAWGVEAHMVTPAEIKELVPFINEEILVGGCHFPTVSCVDSLRAGTIFREQAQALGALQTFANVEVTSMEVVDGQIKAVVTDQGRIEAEYVVIAVGVWAPRLANMAGATIPLTPAVHQMIDVGPIPILEASGKEIGYPIVRDMDTFCYERQTGGSMEVGSYAHRPILMSADDIPSIKESRLSPTELPFTPEDFDDQLEQALELMPSILETAEMKYAINGLLSLTPDGFPVIGETVEVKNLWSCCAIWIKEAPGAARLCAEWMTHGQPEVDPHHSDIARFYDYARTDYHVRARAPRSTSRRPTASSTPVSSGRRSATYAPPPTSTAPMPSAPSTSSPVAGSARTGTSRTPRSSPSTASPIVPTSGMPVGGRRSSTPSTWKCATTSAWSTSPRSSCSTSRARAPLPTCRVSPSITSTWPSAAASTPRCSTSTAASVPT